ncbi:hypothetical protein G6F62_013784 [Rhizopus arrhizus]|nr:hypothetical protein G6F62_013784 [Rhizopus arrhizus]
MAAADLRFGRHAVLVDGLQILGPGQHAEVDLQAGRLPVGGDGLGQFLVLEPAAGRRVQVDGLAIDAGGLQQFGSACGVIRIRLDAGVVTEPARRQQLAVRHGRVAAIQVLGQRFLVHGVVQRLAHAHVARQALQGIERHEGQVARW